MADLEALSNKEIRKKCIEFGLPNVPVTDSSRKLLIRRLNAAISGKPLTPNKTNRRETTQVAKQSQMASSIKIDAAKSKTTTTSLKNNTIKSAPTERRVATTTTVNEPQYSDVSPDRIDITITQKQQRTPYKALYPKLAAKEISPKFSCDEDDYDDEVVFVDDESPLGKNIQRPFLSQFARNLETRKSTPIRSPIVSSARYTPYDSSLHQRDTAAVHRRTMPQSSSTISARCSISQQYSGKN